jgi:hypothetical protein
MDHALATPPPGLSGAPARRQAGAGRRELERRHRRTARA